MPPNGTIIYQQTRKSRFFNFKTIINLLAVFSLIAAYCIGFSQREKNVLVNLQRHYPPGTSLTKVSTQPLLFEVTPGDNKDSHLYVAIEKKHGYGGPVTVGTEVDPSGVIQRVIVIDHKETLVFFKKIQDHQFFDQFIGKKVSAPLELGDDIDAVTGATVSSTAFTNTTRLGSQAIAQLILNLPVQKEMVEWSFGFKEVILLLLYALVFIGVITKTGKLRYITLAAGALFLGFYLNSAISLSNFAVIFLGYFPPLNEKLFWYMLVIGVLLIILIYGKNLYCYWMCPFGAIQEFATKIGVNIPLSKKTVKYAQYIGYFLTWAALMIIFITANSSIGSYEPFATLFGLEGFGVQWYILPAVILGAFVLNRFWCRFFCPVGVVLRLMLKARFRIKRLINLPRKEA